MNNIKLKKQLSLAVFLPFLFVTAYNNSCEKTIIPFYFATALITENEVENTYTIKKWKSIKNLINNLISQSKRVEIPFVNTASFKIIIKDIIVGETAIVLNRGSPVVPC